MPGRWKGCNQHHVSGSTQHSLWKWSMEQRYGCCSLAVCLVQSSRARAEWRSHRGFIVILTHRPPPEAQFSLLLAPGARGHALAVSNLADSPLECFGEHTKASTPSEPS